eukprot:5956496-Amphidinium_carterae.1
MWTIEPTGQQSRTRWGQLSSTWALSAMAYRTGHTSLAAAVTYAQLRNSHGEPRNNSKRLGFYDFIKCAGWSNGSV